jgi:hypothetical protein
LTLSREFSQTGEVVVKACGAYAQLLRTSCIVGYILTQRSKIVQPLGYIFEPRSNKRAPFYPKQPSQADVAPRQTLQPPINMAITAHFEVPNQQLGQLLKIST